jgi:hypothetical protein
MLRTIESSFWMRICGDTVDIICVVCVCVCVCVCNMCVIKVFLVEKNSLDCSHKKAQISGEKNFTQRTRDDDET